LDALPTAEFPRARQVRIIGKIPISRSPSPGSAIRLANCREHNRNICTVESASFAENLVFEIQGDDGVLPWVGHKTGRQAIADFVRDQRAMTDPLAFDVEDVLASEKRAVVIWTLRSRIRATDRITASQFALVLTIADDVVKRFQMLEDSYDVSLAART
jgi:ketosteroid isomerase-like protein